MNDKPLQPIVRTENLSVLYPEMRTQALNGVSLSVSPGEFVAIVGPSGSGKSTLLHALAALIAPSQGEVFFRGTPLSDIRNKSLFRRHNLGFVFQDFYLYPRLTVLENVLLPLAHRILVPRAWTDKAQRLLKDLNMSHKMTQRAHTLSAGERQRVCIARALLAEPPLLLADEPTGSLDTQNATAILDILGHIHSARGVTLMMVTHDTAAAARAQRIVRIVDGKVTGVTYPASR
jgi:ABC-type lipoprotein export system ATPase subunit